MDSLLRRCIQCFFFEGVQTGVSRILHKWGNRNINQLYFYGQSERYRNLKTKLLKLNQYFIQIKYYCECLIWNLGLQNILSSHYLEKVKLFKYFGDYLRRLFHRKSLKRYVYLVLYQKTDEIWIFFFIQKLAEWVKTFQSSCTKLSFKQEGDKIQM